MACSAELTWLMSILRNKVIDRIRLASREVMVAVDSMDDWCGTTDRWLHAPKLWKGNPSRLVGAGGTGCRCCLPKPCSGDPSKLVEDGEFWDQIRKCFTGLPERQAQVFSLRTFDE